MGVASLGKGRALLELEFVEEARRVLISGNKAVGGVQLDLSRWNPRSGCLEEGEVRKEVWVRILGLPISLWVPFVLRRVGDACEVTYILTLWWEAVPSLRQEEGWKRGLWSRPSGEDVGSQAQVGLLQGSGSKTGPAVPGLVLNWVDGLSLPLESEASKGVLLGPPQPRSSGRAAGSGLDSFHKGKAIPSQAHLFDNGLLLKACPHASTDHCKVGNLEIEFVRFREEEIGRRQQPDLNYPMADRMLEEEAARYGLVLNLGGVLRLFWGTKGGISEWKWVTKTKCRRARRERDGCWDLVEVNSVDPLERNSGWTLGQTEFQEGRKEEQLNWEENSLVKFSHFLGFSTEGLEKEILSFLGKIWKMREKILGKGLLENSRFERELKRLECSVNYEGDTKKKGPTQGGVLICWDKRSLEILGWEEGQFSISCRFINVGDGGIWVFTGVYGPFSREERECLWEEFGGDLLLGVGGSTINHGPGWIGVQRPDRGWWQGIVVRGSPSYSSSVGGALGFSGRREDYRGTRSEGRDYKCLPADIGGFLLKQISQSEAKALELPFSEVEIYAALMGMNGDKARVRTDSRWPFGKAVGRLLRRMFWICSRSSMNKIPSLRA
ncbi:hypothetical protein AAG906_004244 [Vitis piasezkii]